MGKTLLLDGTDLDIFAGRRSDGFFIRTFLIILAIRFLKLYHLFRNICEYKCQDASKLQLAVKSERGYLPSFSPWTCFTVF